MMNFKINLQLFATKQASSCSKNGRDSRPKSWGIKVTHDQYVKPGMIIVVNQAHYKLGKNVMYGKNFNIHSLIEGWVMFKKKFVCKGSKWVKWTFVHVWPIY